MVENYGMYIPILNIKKIHPCKYFFARLANQVLIGICMDRQTLKATLNARPVDSFMLSNVFEMLLVKSHFIMHLFVGLFMQLLLTRICTVTGINSVHAFYTCICLICHRCE